MTFEFTDYSVFREVRTLKNLVLISARGKINGYKAIFPIKVQPEILTDKEFQLDSFIRDRAKNCAEALFIADWYKVLFWNLKKKING